MIEVEFGPRQTPRAVLTGVIVASIDIEARKSDMPLGYAFVGGEQQDARHANDSADDPDPFMLDLIARAFQLAKSKVRYCSSTARATP